MRVGLLFQPDVAGASRSNPHLMRIAPHDEQARATVEEIAALGKRIARLEIMLAIVLAGVLSLVIKAFLPRPRHRRPGLDPEPGAAWHDPPERAGCHCHAVTPHQAPARRPLPEGEREEQYS